MAKVRMDKFKLDDHRVYQIIIENNGWYMAYPVVYRGQIWDIGELRKCLNYAHKWGIEKEVNELLNELLKKE